jgi:hypothetical protein
MFEKHALKSGQARGIKMLDNFDNGRGIVAGKTRVAIHERTLEQFDAFSFPGRKHFESKPIGRFFENPRRHINPNDFREGRISEERSEQAPLSATEVEDALRTRLAQHRQDRTEALLIQADAFFERTFFGSVDFGSFVGVCVLVFRQASKRLTH